MGNGKNYPESDVYVRIDPSDAIQAKKDLLEVTASLINMQMINEKVKQNGKIEVRQRAEAKAEVKSMSVVLNHLINELPKINVQKLTTHEIESREDSSMFDHRGSAPKQEAKAKQAPAKPKKASLNDELLEIKRKLADLR